LKQATTAGNGNFFEDFRPGQIIHHNPARTLTDADQTLYTALTQMEPYGLGFPKPRLVLADAKILYRQTMKEKHMKLTLADTHGTTRLEAIAFNVGGTNLGELLARAECLHLYGELAENHWQGTRRLQFIIDDAAKGHS
jgi:single-stranded-DNA-specific exonuclease